MQALLGASGRPPPLSGGLDSFGLISLIHVGVASRRGAPRANVKTPESQEERVQCLSVPGHVLIKGTASLNNY